MSKGDEFTPLRHALRDRNSALLLASFGPSYFLNITCLAFCENAGATRC